MESLKMNLEGITREKGFWQGQEAFSKRLHQKASLGRTFSGSLIKKDFIWKPSVETLSGSLFKKDFIRKPHQEGLHQEAFGKRLRQEALVREFFRKLCRRL